MIIQVVRMTPEHYRLPWNEMQINVVGTCPPGSHIHIYLDAKEKSTWKRCCLRATKEDVISHAIRTDNRNSQAIMIQTDESFDRIIKDIEFNFDILMPS